MLLSACPQCAMPRAEADIAGRPCPLCGYVAGQTVAPYVDEPPPVVLPEPAPVVAPEPKRPPRFIAVVSIAAIGLGFLLGKYTSPAKTVEVKSTEVVEVVKFLPLPQPTPAPPPAPVEVAPFPREVEAVAVEPVRPPAVQLPGGVSLIKLDRPNDVFTLERIGEGNIIKLTGRVSKLVVSGVDGGATFDASELDVKTITFNGKIEGNAQIKVKALNATISFTKAVSGGAKIELNAPGSSINFWTTGATVSGGAKLRITGKSVWFHNRIDGGTMIEATITNAGSLKFFELADGSKIHYRGENLDEEVRIIPGKIDDSSECKRLD